MKIANRNIGFNYEPLIVAEIGINHNGSLKEAFKLIDAAQKAGVEVIKHQTHIVEDEMSADAKKVYPGNSPDKSIYDIMKDCELSEGEEIELQKGNGLVEIAFPLDFQSQEEDREGELDTRAEKN